MSKKLSNLDIEEGKRKVMGLSGCRRCLFLTEFEAQLETEKRYPDKKGAARVLAAMEEDGLNTDSPDFNIDTLARYHDPIPMSIHGSLCVRFMIAWVLLRCCGIVVPQTGCMAISDRCLYLTRCTFHGIPYSESNSLTLLCLEPCYRDSRSLVCLAMVLNCGECRG
jgi:hypothetical protein